MYLRNREMLYQLLVSFILYFIATTYVKRVGPLIRELHILSRWVSVVRA